ncbi:Osmotin thaumatin-like protein [Mycena rebaudengoi]|nr:Osmotin thaumatin-like protein [Mycena rebaudengoi]
MKAFFNLLALAIVSGVVSQQQQRRINVVNACNFTIWPAIGRIWGRTDCSSTFAQGPNSCLTGGCNGGLICDSHTGTGVPPATLAQFSMGGSNGGDFYDVSLVDGFNLPMRIDNNVCCEAASCPVDLTLNCPSDLNGPINRAGDHVGYKNPQAHSLAANSSNCCSGSHNTPAICPSSGVSNYDYFHTNCPNAFAYAFDGPTAQRTCVVSSDLVYTVTFCPNA